MPLRFGSGGLAHEERRDVAVGAQRLQVQALLQLLERPEVPVHRRLVDPDQARRGVVERLGDLSQIRDLATGLQRTTLGASGSPEGTRSVNGYPGRSAAGASAVVGGVEVAGGVVAGSVPPVPGVNVATSGSEESEHAATTTAAAEARNTRREIGCIAPVCPTGGTLVTARARRRL